MGWLVSHINALYFYSSVFNEGEISPRRASPPHLHMNSPLENLDIDDKFVNERVRHFIHRRVTLKRVEKKKLLGRHSKDISLKIAFAK